MRRRPPIGPPDPALDGILKNMKTLVPYQTVQALLAAPMPPTPSSDIHVVQFWLSQVRTANTLKSYWGDLGMFTTWAGPVALKDIGLGHLIAWSKAMEAQGDAPTSVQRRISAVRSLLKFAHSIGWIPANVGAAFKLPKTQETWTKRYLEPEEVQAMIAAAATQDERLMIRMLYVLGLRAEELLALKWADIRKRDERGIVTVFGKGQKTRHVPIPEQLWLEVRQYRHFQKSVDHKGEDEDWLFEGRGGHHHLSRDSLGRIIRRLARNAGVAKKVTPHWFRHTHATHARRKGADLEVIQSTLGHASLSTTRRYLLVDPDKSSSFLLDPTLPPLPEGT